MNYTEEFLKKLSDQELAGLQSGDLTKLSDQNLALLQKVQTKTVTKKDFEPAAMKIGRAETNPVVRGLLNVAQGPTFGFADELYGAAGGALRALQGKGSFSDEYAKMRDYARGVQEQYKEDFPIGSVATQMAASAPTLAIGRAGAATQAMPSMMANVGRAAATGAGYGGLSAAGESQYNPLEAGFYSDIGKGAAFGGATGGVVQGAAPVARAASQQIAPRVSPTSAAQYAKEKVAEAIVRGAPESAAATPLTQAQAKLRAMGPEARLADVSEATRGLLDVTATLPGRTKDLLAQAQRERMRTEAQRMMAGGEAALGQEAGLFRNTLEDLNAARQTFAKPFYNVIDNATATVDADLLRLLQRSQSAHGGAEKLLRMETGDVIDLSNLAVGDKIPFRVLDTVKKSLDDIVSSSQRSGDKNLSRVAGGVTDDLVTKLKDISPKVGGKSAYAQALEQWAGPSKLMDAMELGAGALRGNADELRAAMQKMTAGEIEAFRMGAAQSLKQMVGTQAGRTSLINFWKNPNTSDQLKLVFGNDFNTFKRTLLQEEKLRPFTQLGKGSQTAARQAGAEDMGISAMQTAGELAAAAKGGLTPGLLGTLANQGRRLTTPEPVRNEIGRLLLTQDQAEIAGLRDFLARLNETRRIQALRTGAGGGMVASQLFQP